MHETLGYIFIIIFAEMVWPGGSITWFTFESSWWVYVWSRTLEWILFVPGFDRPTGKLIWDECMYEYSIVGTLILRTRKCLNLYERAPVRVTANKDSFVHSPVRTLIEPSGKLGKFCSYTLGQIYYFKFLQLHVSYNSIKKNIGWLFRCLRKGNTKCQPFPVRSKLMPIVIYNVY